VGHFDKANEPAPRIVVMLVMAAGMWVLVYLGVASVWPRDRFNPTTEGTHTPQLAVLTGRPNVTLPTRTKVRAKRKRRKGLPLRWARLATAAEIGVARDVHHVANDVNDGASTLGFWLAYRLRDDKTGARSPAYQS
jgi:hypothetical protein